MVFLTYLDMEKIVLKRKANTMLWRFLFFSVGMNSLWYTRSPRTKESPAVSPKEIVIAFSPAASSWQSRYPSVKPLGGGVGVGRGCLVCEIVAAPVFLSLGFCLIIWRHYTTRINQVVSWDGNRLHSLIKVVLVFRLFVPCAKTDRRWWTNESCQAMFCFFFLRFAMVFDGNQVLSRFVSVSI